MKQFLILATLSMLSSTALSSVEVKLIDSESSAMISHTLAKETSNRITRDLLDTSYNMFPENASSLGLNEFDKKVTPFDPETFDNLVDDIEKKILSDLDNEIANAQDKDVLTDLNALRHCRRITQELRHLFEKHQRLSTPKTSESIFSALQTLVNPQTSLERKKSAVDRFNKYVNGFDGLMPNTKANIAYFNQKKEEFSAPVFPLKDDVERYLKSSPAYVEGIKDLLKQTARDDWHDTFDTFEKQIKEHDDFVKSEILPHALASKKMPLDLYESILGSQGVYATAQQLIDRAQKDFDILFKEYESLANEIAQKHNLEKNDPISVSNFLKKELYDTPEELLKAFYDIREQIVEDMIHDDLLTPAERLESIRLGTPAESAEVPVPHVRIPPLFNNSGEVCEYILPINEEGKVDPSHTFKASLYTLTAHEATPGHCYQFHRALEQELSHVRTFLTDTPANHEGWALYAEYLMYPYFELEGKFIGLQDRLLRVARMFLDPQVNLGQASRKDVSETLCNKIGFAQSWADIEYDRYAFMAPGQATSYYYGLTIFLDTKEKVKEILGNDYNEKWFNDTLINKGLLPMNILQQSVIDDAHNLKKK